MFYRKLKRTAAILLVLMLSLTAFTGCSATDAGYLAMLLEVSKLDSYTFSGEFTFELNQDFLDPYGDAGPMKVYADMSGGVIMSGDDLYLDCKLKYGINDNKKPNEMNIIISDMEILIPVKDALEAMDVGFRLEGYPDKMRGEIKAALEKELAGYEYFKYDLFETPDMNELMESVMGEKAVAISELVIKSLNDMFSGFDSGMTKRITNGYALEVTPEKIVTLADNLVKYVDANKKKLYKDVVKLIKGIENIYGEELVPAEALEEQDFYDMIDELTGSYQEMSEFDREALQLALKGSYIKDSYTKSGGTYMEAFDMSINYEGKKVFSIKGQMKYVKEEVKRSDLRTIISIDMETFGDIADAVLKKINHAKEIGITWWNGEYNNMTSMNVTRLQGFDWDYTDKILEAGTMYLPMRQICEWFGEDVEWDNAAKKAYVVRGAERTEMTGRIQNSRTFIKVRDFEKLGYVVDYEYDSDWGMHKVTLKKN